MKAFFSKNAPALTLLAILLLVGGFFLGRWLYSSILEQNADKARAGFQFHDARKAYRQILEIDPNNARVLSKAADLSLFRRQYPDALSYAKRAAGIDPGNPKNYLVMGESQAKTGDGAGAEASFKKALELDPGMDAARRALAGVLYESGRAAEAIALLHKVTMEDPRDPQSFILLYGIYNREGQHEKALSVLEKALDLPAPPWDLYYALLKVFDEKGQEGRVDEVSRKMLEKYRDNPQAYMIISYEFEKRSRFQQAEDVLASLMSLPPPKDPKDLSYYYALANFYFRQKHYKAAIGTLEEALLQDPNSAGVYYYMGMIYYSLEDWENCERELKRSLSIEENTPYVLNLLAWMYVTVPRDSTFYRPKAAMSLARKAVSAHPHSVYIDTQARAAYASGDIQEAARLYQRNIDSKKSVRYANYGLAVCSFRQGRQKEGAEYLKTSLKLKFRDKRLIRNDMDIPEIRNNPAIKEILADKEPQGLE